MAESLTKDRCPQCGKPSYVNHGNMNDLSRADTEGQECPFCGHQWLYEEVDWVDIAEANIEKGRKRLSDEPFPWKEVAKKYLTLNKINFFEKIIMRDQFQGLAKSMKGLMCHDCKERRDTKGCAPDLCDVKEICDAYFNLPLWLTEWVEKEGDDGEEGAQKGSKESDRPSTEEHIRERGEGEREARRDKT